MKRGRNQNIVIGTDANYLLKAVVYYKSLYKYYKNFTLHIFCFDDVTLKTLKKLNLKNVVLYNQDDFETEELLALKKSKKRSYEYYWAINAYITKFVMDKVKPESVLFSDCDCMFFDSPEIIFNEAKAADVLIQPNNFSIFSVKDFIPVGYYCSSFVFFRNNKNGHRVLNDWHNKCMNWCSSTFENGKFGDQKYLDEWRIKFRKVNEVANPGANVAPWNVQKFDVGKVKGKVVLNGKWPLIYYHFHSFRINFKNNKYVITGDRNNSYEINKYVIDNIYKPYIKMMISTLKTIKRIPEFNEYIKTNPEGNYHVTQNNLDIKTPSIWGNPGNFFYDFLRDVEKSKLPKTICVLGAGDGRYVIPAAMGGFKCTAIDVNTIHLYGGLDNDSKLPNKHVLGLQKRVLLQGGIENSVNIINGDFVSLTNKKQHSGVFIQAAFHYDVNSQYSTDELLTSIGKYVSKGGLLYIEYIHATGDNLRSGQKYLTAKELETFFSKGWKVLKNQVVEYIDKKNPRHPGKHKLLWGTFYVQKNKK